MNNAKQTLSNNCAAWYLFEKDMS